MQLKYIESMTLPKGVPVSQYEESAAGLTAAIADLRKAKLPATTTPEGIIVGVCNKYARQKDALVDARDFLWTAIKTRTGFAAYPTEKKTVGGKEVTVEKLAEQKNIDLFVSKLVDGTFKHDAFKITGTDPADRTKAVWDVLQSWIDDAAKTEDKVNEKGEVVGTQPLSNGRLSRWTIDLSVPERTSKPKTPPDYAVKNAESIWSDTTKDGAKKPKNLAARLDQWATEFTKKGVTFDDFRTFDAKDEASVAAAKTRLAWAIKANEDFEREQREKANPYK